MEQRTFHDLCKSLKKTNLGIGNEELDILASVADALTGDSTEVSTITVLMGILSQKMALVKLGKKILDKILDRKSDQNYIERINQMRDAYGTICFTAFFDELDSQLPENIRQAIQLSMREKQDLFHSARRLYRTSGETNILFPDIVYGYDATKKFLDELYHTMAEKLYQFITGLIFKESASEKDILALNKIIENLPEASLKRFYEQFLSLCSQFNEFYIFMETGREREWETKVDKCYQAALSAATHIQKTTEAGFADLKAIILNLQNYCKTDQVQEIVDGLINTYHMINSY